MPYLACEGSVTAVDAVCVDLAFAGRDKMPDTLMGGIEEALPVKRAAFEYDGELSHFLRKRVMVREHKR